MGVQRVLFLAYLYFVYVNHVAYRYLKSKK